MNANYLPYLQSEIDYRRERIASGTRKTRHHRFPRVRRTAAAPGSHPLTP